VVGEERGGGGGGGGWWGGMGDLVCGRMFFPDIQRCRIFFI